MALHFVHRERLSELRNAIEGGDLNVIGPAAQALANSLGGCVDFDKIGPGIAALYLMTLLVPELDHD